MSPLKIGYDAKRAFFNRRGLGNYSRDTVRIMSNLIPGNEYFLYTPKIKESIDFPYNKENCRVVTPHGLSSVGILSSLWRTKGVCENIEADKLDIYHGLSHELPYGIEKMNVRKVVTMHDVIFLKNPELFPFFDRYSFKKKYTHGCQIADCVVAVSQQTKADLIEYLGEKEERIKVVYQGCNPVFQSPVDENRMLQVKQNLHLPDQFMLIVCAIERRKNHELILKAMRDPRVDIPLVVIGRPSEYQKHLQELIAQYHLEGKVIFLNEVATSELPIFYKLATLFVYPSLFEGFGIPILEALTMRTPVITSKGSCFEETGGEAAQYVSSDNAEELADTIVQVLGSQEIQNDMIRKGIIHAEKFSDKAIAQNLMNVYKTLL